MTEAIVHESAQVHETAVLGHGVWIGPRVVIGPGVWIGAYSVIGGMPEHRDFYDDTDLVRSKGVHIMAHARIFEFVTIHPGTERMTVIGQRSAVFNHSHIAHDVIIGEKVTIAAPSSVGGFCEIQDFATVGGGARMHQKSTVGAYAFLGAASFLKGHIPPGALWLGNPARPAGMNDIGLKRWGLTVDQVNRQWLEKFETIKGRSGL